MCSITEIKNAIPMLDELPMGVLITDIEGSIEYVNNYFVKLTGYSLKEVKGKTPRILKSGEHKKEFYKELWDTVLSGKVYENEVKNKKKNGKIYWQKVAIQPYRNNEGKIENFIAYITDITNTRHDLLLYETMIKTGFDTHIIWDKNKRAIELYPSMVEGHLSFYSVIKNKTLEESTKEFENVCDFSNLLKTHEQLFKEVDKDSGNCFNAIIKVDKEDGEKIILEVIMRRFNSDKYYEVIRNITTFVRNREALINLESALKNFTEIHIEKKEFIDGKRK